MKTQNRSRTIGISSNQICYSSSKGRKDFKDIKIVTDYDEQMKVIGDIIRCEIKWNSIYPDNFFIFKKDGSTVRMKWFFNVKHAQKWALHNADKFK